MTFSMKKQTNRAGVAPHPVSRRTVVPLILVSITLAVPVLSSPQISPDSMAKFNAAKKEKASGNRNEAIRLALEAVKIDQNNHWSYALLGDLYKDGIEYKKAREAYAKAFAANDPRNPDLFSVEYLEKEGYCYFQLLQYNKALDRFNRSITLAISLKIERLQRTAYISRGNVYHALGEDEKAVKDYTRAIENGRQIPVRNDIVRVALNQRAISLILLGHYDEACADFSESCKMGDNTACENRRKHCSR